MARGGPWRATRSMSFAIVVLSPTDVDAKRARDAARRLMSLHKLPRGFRRFPARGQYTSRGSPPTALGARCLNICKPVVGELGKEAHSIATGSATHLPARHHLSTQRANLPVPTITPNAAAQRARAGTLPKPGQPQAMAYRPMPFRQLPKTGTRVLNAALVAIAEAGAIPPLVALLRNGSADRQEQAAAALGLLAGNNAVTAATVEADSIAPLVALVRNGRAVGQERAARALANIARGSRANQAAIVEAGGIAPLVELVRNGHAGGKERATEALRNLAQENAAIQAAIVEAGAIPPLVMLVRDGAVRGHQENSGTLLAAQTLALLAGGGVANQAAIVAADTVEALLGTLPLDEEHFPAACLLFGAIDFAAMASELQSLRAQVHDLDL